MFYICSTLSLLKLRSFGFQILFPGPIGRCYLTRWSISGAPAVEGGHQRDGGKELEEEEEEGRDL